MKYWEKLRLLMLPLMEINAVLPTKGLIYEIGCGNGVLGKYLAQKSPLRQVIGLETQENKFFLAQKDKPKNSNFINFDALKFQYKKCNGAVMSDFLHHMEYDKQLQIIKIIYCNLANKGVLIIKEIDKANIIRQLLSRLWDFLLYPEDKIYYRSVREWVDLLNHIGFEVDSKKAVLWFPGSTNLLICRKND